MRKKQAKKHRALNVEKLGFVPELMGVFCCTVVEDKSILIENGGDITVFNSNLIVLENGCKRISIRGKGLGIYEMGSSHIGVEGEFAGIEYEKGDTQ